MEPDTGISESDDSPGNRPGIPYTEHILKQFIFARAQPDSRKHLHEYPESRARCCPIPQVQYEDPDRLFICASNFCFPAAHSLRKRSHVKSRTQKDLTQWEQQL